MVCDVARPDRPVQLPFPKSKRSLRRARKHAVKLPRDARDRQRVLRRRGLTDEQERAYFARWPSSAYPGLLMPHRELMRLPTGPELVRIWRRLHERWQQVRERFIRFHARTIDDKVVIYGTSIMYRDMRYWMCRRCGFDANDAAVWAWWTGQTRERLTEANRLWFVDASRGKGMYFNQRRAWSEKRQRAAA